jgi:hypothetical protein
MYARRIRKLTVNPSRNPLLPDVLSVLQHSTLNMPLLPGLKTFECLDTTAAFIPFIPLFLSPRTMIVDIKFVKFTPNHPPLLMIASMITAFSTLCPNLQGICLRPLPRDLAITTSVSEMLFACDQNSFQTFDVDSPLTDATCEILYRLPNLSHLWLVPEGPTTLIPSVALPNLTRMSIGYSHSHKWLQRFSGASLNKLTSVTFYADSPRTQVNGFLEEFERVALSTSIPTTLLTFAFHAPSPWNPTYSSLLAFKQLRDLTITNPCCTGCSSKVDDDLVINLSRAMPRLNVLRLGSEPCRRPTGVTIKGLVELACHCTNLSTDEPAPRKECALTTLEVGGIPIPAPAGSAFAIALALIHVFPRLNDIKYTNAQWGHIANVIKISKRLSKRISALAHSSSHNA